MSPRVEEVARMESEIGPFVCFSVDIRDKEPFDTDLFDRFIRLTGKSYGTAFSGCTEACFLVIEDRMVIFEPSDEEGRDVTIERVSRAIDQTARVLAYGKVLVEKNGKHSICHQVESWRFPEDLASRSQSFVYVSEALIPRLNEGEEIFQFTPDLEEIQNKMAGYIGVG